MDLSTMDPQAMTAMLAQMMQQGGQRENPLGRAFGATPPMYGGVAIRPSQMFDFSGLPGMQQGNPFSMVAGMALQSALPSILGPNYIPGQFSPTQNFYDHRRSMQYFNEQRRAMDEGSRQDRETYFRMIRGVDRMAGIGMPEDQQRRLAGDIAGFTPILSQFIGGEMFDQLHGVRGSSRMLSQGIFEGGRYKFDPITGRLGYSGETAGRVADEVTQMLYGPGADLTRMKGIGGTQAGKLFDEMTRRGIGPSMLDPDQIRSGLAQELAQSRDSIRAPELRKLQDRIGLGGGGANDSRTMSRLQEEINKLDPQAFEAASRSFDSTRATRAMEKMSGAVAAMRDIFGDMGKPNAPMVELLNGLNSMTQGGLTTMAPDKIERSVRETYAIAKATGLGIEGIAGFSGTAANLLQAQGVSRGLAPQIAQSSAAYGMAYGARGTPTGLDIMNNEQASQIDIALRAQAVNSPQATRLGALMQLNDRMQRIDREGKTVTGFTSGSEAAAMSRAIADGKTTYEFNGRTQSVFKSANDMENVLVAGGSSRLQARNLMLSDPALFAATNERYNTQNILRQGQLDLDIRPRLSRAMSQGADVALADARIPQAQRDRLSGRLGSAIFDQYRDLMETNRELFSDGREGELNKTIAANLRRTLGRDVEGLNDAQLANLVDTSSGAANRFIRTSPAFANARDLRNLFLVNGRRTFNTQDRILDDAKAVSRVQAAFSGLGQEGLAGRVSDYIQRVGPGGGNIRDLVSRSLGGIGVGDAADSTTALVQNIANLREQYDTAGNTISEPAKLQKERNRLLKEIETIMPDVSRSMDGRMDELSPRAKKIIEAYRAAEARRPRQPDAAQPLPTTEINWGRSPTDLPLPTTELPWSNSRTSLTPQAAAAPGATTQVATARDAVNPLGQQRISGTLVLEGLDRAILTGALTGLGDARSATT